MRINLKKLKLKNFKGIKNLEVNFSDITNIYGDNATGKTTIFDAYSWLLWDKDSLNRKDFGIKPYDKDGQEIHNLESSVEGVLLFDDKELNLKKIYKEIWTKKRGSLTEEFTGNTTDYYINSVPVKKKEFTDRISSVLTEDNFNLLSNPLYFNSILDKKSRREFLLSLIEEVDREKIIEVNPDLRELDLENYSIDEIRSMAKASAKKINKEIESIPARIDELNSTIEELDFDALEFRKRSTTPAIEKIDAELADVSKVSERIREISSEISEMTKEKLKIISEIDRKNSNTKESIALKKSQYKDKKQHLKERIKYHKDRIETLKKDKENAERRIEDCRQRWVDAENEFKTDKSKDMICPYCGSDLPEDKIAEVIGNLNVQKSTVQENCEKAANNYKSGIESIDKHIEEIRRRIIEDEKEIAQLKEPSDKIDILPYPEEVEELEGKIKDKEKELSGISEGDKSDLIDKKSKLTKELEEINSKLALREQNKKIKARIEELSKSEKDLAKNYEAQQKILYLCDQYTKIYVDIVSESINKLFDLVKFKLFDTQINGGIQETCEVTVNGVPFSDLNSAMKINAGLDVINSIGEKLNLSVPIFIDNAESVNELIAVNSQIIRLIVSKDKELKIE